MFRSSNFDKSLENATSHLHLEPDWHSIMIICDTIRQGDVTAKYAVLNLKKKMFSQNPHTSLYALLVLESIVKNCGTPVHDEIANKANCEMFASLVNSTQHDDVKAKMLELIQAWAYAFRSAYKYRSIKDTMNILKTEGHKFPELKEADAMFVSDIAPDWADGEVCHRCRVSFSFTQRKHHCRNCGQVFCAQCSSKTSTLPKFGIEKEVRVCEGCYGLLQQKPTPGLTKKATEEEDLPAEYLSSSLAQQNQVVAPARKTDQELQEEEELQLALALSQSEAESKKPATVAAVRRSYPKSPSPEPVPVQKSPSPVDEPPSDPELARYLNRGYWEQRQATESPASPSAPSPMPSPMPQPVVVSSTLKGGPDDIEINDFANMMKSQVEIFVNRMKSNSSRGRNISCDTSVQTLFLNLTSLHSKLLTYIKDMDDKRMWYEQLQDKLVQIKDSRAALDVLRQEHQEKLRRIAEEQERQRQMQMAQKLEIMRKKKQEYLQYQRQLALQRIQDQEREMQMRQEQQKAQYRMGAQTFPFMSPPGPGQPQSSPVHMGVANYPPGYGYNQIPGSGTLPRYGPNNQPLTGVQGQQQPGQQPGMNMGQQMFPAQQFMGPQMGPQNVENQPGMNMMPGQVSMQNISGQIPMQQPQQQQPQQQQQQHQQQPQQQQMMPPNSQSIMMNQQQPPHPPLQQQQSLPEQQLPPQQQPPPQQQQPPQQPQQVAAASPPAAPAPVPAPSEPETAELISFD